MTPDLPTNLRALNPSEGGQTFHVDEVLNSTRLNPLQFAIIVVCIAVLFVDGVDRTGLGLVGRNFMSTLHISATGLGIVFSMDNLGAVIGALLCGRLSDRLGSKKVMLATLSIIVVATLLTVSASSLMSLATIRFIAGLGLGGAVPASLAMSSDYVRPNLRGTVAALVFAGYSIGAACGGLWSAFLLAHFKWQSLLYVGSILPALVLVGAIFIPETMQYLLRTQRPSRAGRIATRLHPALRAAPFHLVDGLKHSDDRGAAGAFRELFSRRFALATVLLWTIYIFLFSSVRFAVTWLPNILTTHGISPSQAAATQGVWNVGSLVGEIIVVWLIKRMGATTTMLPALLLACAAFSVIGFDVSNLHLIVPTVILAGVGCGAAVSGVIAATATLYPTALRGTGIGGGIAAARFGQVVSPLMIGWMIDTAIGIQSIMLVVAAFPLAAALLIWPFRRVARRPEPAPA